MRSRSTWLVLRRNPLKTGLSTARRRSARNWTEQIVICRNPLKTGLSTASTYVTDGILRRCLESQSPENGSQHCKTPRPGRTRSRSSSQGRNPLKTGLSTASLLIKNGRKIWFRLPSQSPENGSQHCKGLFGLPHREEGAERRNPLKTGLSTARNVVPPSGYPGPCRVAIP